MRLGSTFGDTRKCAERGHVARPKLPPIRQHRRQSCSDFIGAQAQESMSGPSYERPLQPRASFRLQRQCLIRLPQGQQTMWRKNGRQHHHAEYILMIDQPCRLVPGDPHEFIEGHFASSNWSRSAKRSCGQ